MAPLTADELMAHPEYPYVHWNLPPHRKGRVPVARDRGGPIRIAYEIHGTGPVRLLFLIGLGGIKSGWQRQTRDFGHGARGARYSVLVLDNRGVGESERPLRLHSARGRYSTAAMARDVVEVLDHVGWRGERAVHVVGLSMGGMIAQELALLIPMRIASIVFVSTAPRIRNTMGFFENLRHRASILIPQSLDTTLASIKHYQYSPDSDFLTSPDELEYVKARFPTNGDRCMAIELAKRTNRNLYPRSGLLQQALACATHSKSATQLALLASQVGPRRLLVVHGTADGTVPVSLGAELLGGLGGQRAGCQVRWVEGQGHVIPVEMRDEFGGWVRAWVERWERSGVAEGWEGEVDGGFEGGSGGRANGHANGHVRMNGSVEKYRFE